MNPTVKTFIGATIGGAIGWFVGQVLVEYLHMQEDTTDYHDTNEFDPSINNEEVEELRPMSKESRLRTVGKTQAKKDYTKMFENRPDIIELAKKYNGISSGLEQKEIGSIATPVELMDDDIVAFAAKYNTNEGTITPVQENVHDGITADSMTEDELFEIDDTEQIDPAIITMEEFANAEDYGHVSLWYYQDDILTDELGTPIDRPERFLGEDALVSFDDNGVVYVRNQAKKVMYEVIQQEQNYTVPSTRRGPAAKRTVAKKEMGNVNEEDDTD